MSTLNIIIRSSLCFIFAFLPLSNLDQWIYDSFFLLRGQRKPPANIVILEIPENQLQSFTDGSVVPNLGTWPELSERSLPIWTGSFHDRLFEEVQKLQPKLVIVTTFYKQADSGNFFGNTSNTLYSSRLTEQDQDVLPFQSAIDERNFGFNNLYPDSDNTFRRITLVRAAAVSVSLRTYYRTEHTAGELDIAEPVALNFIGPNKSFPTINAFDFSKDPTAYQKAIKNKYVVIGHSKIEPLRMETPVGPLTQAEIQANAINALINKDGLVIAPAWLKFVVACVSILLSVLLILYLPLKLGWVSLLLFGLSVFLMNFFLFVGFGVWIGTANAVVSIFGTYLLMLGFKLGRQEEEQWRLRAEANRIREMDQFRNNFISLFSHDLKTPISKIKAIVGRARSESSISPETETAFRDIERTTNELGRLISDILKVTKMEAMTLKVNKKVVDLNRLVEASVDSLQHDANTKNIRFAVELEPLFSTDADAKLIQEVMTNLIENAIKYSPKETTISIKTKEKDDKIYFIVGDQGPGIQASELPKVISKFYRGKRASETTKGTGLGLFLAKYFVELHGGQLEIQSEVGKGTAVSFFIPIT